MPDTATEVVLPYRYTGARHRKIGASNVMRVTPKWLAIPVTLCDIGKGALAVCWLNWLGWKVELKLPSGLPL